MLPDCRCEVRRPEFFLGIDNNLEVIRRHSAEFVQQFDRHHELRHRPLGIRCRAREHTPVGIEPFVHGFPPYLLPVALFVPFLQHGNKGISLCPG